MIRSLITFILLFFASFAMSQTQPIRNPKITGTGTIDAGATLTNSGTFTNSGTINGAGIFNFGSGTLTLPATVSGGLSSFQALDADLTAIAGISGVQGDIIYRNASTWVRLAAGTSGYFLKTQGAGADPVWAVTSGAVAADTIWDAAGDLAIGTGADTAARLAIGTNGQVLTSNGTTATWTTPASGISGLTAGRVTFSTAATTIGDDAGFTYNSGTDTLTAANIVGSTGLTIGGGSAITSSGAGGALGALAWLSVVGSSQITDGSVALADMADLAQDQFIGRTTASTGVPQTATITAAARTMLDDTTVSAMVNTIGGATSTGSGGLVRINAPVFATNITSPVINGSSVNSGTITLRGTSAGTPGNLYLQDAGGNIYIGGGTTISSVRFLEASGNGTDIAEFKVPASLAANIAITLPSTTGTLIGTGNLTDITGLGTIVDGIVGTSSITLGTNGGTGGSVVLNGSTSGSATISVGVTGVLALPSGTTATNMSLITPALGTPSSGILTSCTIKAELVIACSDETTSLTTGTAKVTFRMPYAMTLTGVRASVNTAPTGSTIIVDINEGGSTLMTTTKLSIDASEFTSTTAASAAALTDTALADDAEITIDLDQIGSTIAGKGLKVTLIGTRN